MRTQNFPTPLTSLLAAVGFALATVSALGQAPVISSLSQNGKLVCTNLLPGSTASVEWASSPAGPWTNNWAGLDAVTVDSNGMIQVGVPMYYRVRGTPPPPGMALIPAGDFTMGDTLNDWPPESGTNPEIPVHTVYVSAFYMDKYEVTKALWDEVRIWAHTNGYGFGTVGSGKATNHPVQSVNWFDAVKWCNARSEREGRVPAYYTSAAQTTVYRTGSVDVQNGWVKWNTGYRLPTEAEWEKAARGGARGHRFPWTDTDNITHSQANYYSSTNWAYDTSPTRRYHPIFNDGVNPLTSPAGYFAANGYGLYDMVGNVWEWCWDWYGPYSSSSQTDPHGPASGPFLVLRGGGWSYDASACRSAYRGDLGDPSHMANSIGFRSVLPPSQ